MPCDLFSYTNALTASGRMGSLALLLHSDTEPRTSEVSGGGEVCGKRHCGCFGTWWETKWLPTSSPSTQPEAETWGLRQAFVELLRPWPPVRAPAVGSGPFSSRRRAELPGSSSLCLPASLRPWGKPSCSQFLACREPPSSGCRFLRMRPRMT